MTDAQHAPQAMRALAARVAGATRKRLLGTAPLFEPYRPATPADLDAVERRLGTTLPADLKAWLLAIGFGDIAEALSFRAEWFAPVGHGALRGATLFAQDECGNFLASAPHDGAVLFFARRDPQYAAVAPDFASFMLELERRDFRLDAWTDALSLQPCDWNAGPEGDAPSRMR